MIIKKAGMRGRIIIGPNINRMKLYRMTSRKNGAEKGGYEVFLGREDAPSEEDADKPGQIIGANDLEPPFHGRED